MQLTDDQQDALTELINIAFARTAASLSELTGDRVDLETPEVAVHSFRELPAALNRFVEGDITTIHQIFSGSLDGDALLVLGHEGAVNLVKLLTGEEQTGGRLGTAGREVLSEVGNILLNACLGIFGNLLQIRLSFTVPQLHGEALHGLLDSLAVGREELQCGLIIGARFRIRHSEVEGSLVIVLGIASLDQLLAAVEDWRRRGMTLESRSIDLNIPGAEGY